MVPISTARWRAERAWLLDVVLLLVLIVDELVLSLALTFAVGIFTSDSALLFTSSTKIDSTNSNKTSDSGLALALI